MTNIVFCIIQNDKREILLQKKTLDYETYPGMWSLVGGTAESNDFKKELDREVQEEIGIKLPLKFEFEIDYEEPKRNPSIRHYPIFSANLSDISKISIGEGAGLAFFGEKELNNLEIIPVCNNVLKLFLNKNKKKLN